MNISIENVGEKIILRLDGRLDATSSPLLENKLSHYVDERYGAILIDFLRVDYLSSAGLRLLLSITKKLKARGGLLILFNMNDEVMEIIKMAGFDRILAIFPDEKDALAAT